MTVSRIEESNRILKTLNDSNQDFVKKLEHKFGGRIEFWTEDNLYKARCVAVHGASMQPVIGSGIDPIDALNNFTIILDNTSDVQYIRYGSSGSLSVQR